MGLARRARSPRPAADEMRRDGDLDPRLVVERRAAGGRRLRRMALPCLFVGQLLLFVTCVYWSYPASEERPRHSLDAPVGRGPLRPPLAERPVRQEAGASAPSESAAQRPEAANDPIGQWTNVALPSETEKTEKAVGSTSAAETGSEGARRAAEDEDDETARRRREDEEDDEARLRPPVQEPAPNATWAGLRGRCLEKAKGFWTYQVCVGEGVQQFHYTSSHGVAEQTRARLGFHAPALDTVAPRSEKYTEGDMCKLTKAPRETTVHYICGQTDQLQRVEEPAPCIYELHATVRAACEPAAETGERGWHQLLLFSPLEYRSQ